MKNKIERTLLWFKDGSENIDNLDKHFFGLATLLNRLLNKSYDGKKIQFINIDFASEEKYKMFPAIPMDYTHYRSGGGGILYYYGVIDFNEFSKLDESEQHRSIWAKAYDYLQKASKEIKNDHLLKASTLAYNKGIEIDLNPDYKVIENEISIGEQTLNASVWINFKKDGMYSKFSLEKEDIILFEKDIDKTENGVEFFLEIYKSIEVLESSIVIKGDKDIDYLPMNIPIEDLKI